MSPIRRKAAAAAIAGRRSVGDRGVADRRVKKTRSALERSFDGLLLGEGYESATPARVAQAAEVGRSTFYEHFSGRDGLLEQRLAMVMRPLADLPTSPTVPAELEPALEHFWSNRVMIRSLLTGRPRRVAMRVLTGLIKERLPAAGMKPALPAELIASQIGGGQIAMLEEWLSGRRHCAASVLAAALHASSLTAARALIELPHTGKADEARVRPGSARPRGPVRRPS